MGTQVRISRMTTIRRISKSMTTRSMESNFISSTVRPMTAKRGSSWITNKLSR